MKLACAIVVALTVPVAAQPAADPPPAPTAPDAKAAEDADHKPADAVVAKPEPAPDAANAEPSAASAEGAPLPGRESGRLDREPGDSTGVAIGRGALYLPKLLIAGIAYPVHGLVYLSDRYHLSELYFRLFFFNAKHSIGILPTFTYETGFGFSYGLQFVDTDLFGEHESLSAQATTGAVLYDAYRETAVLGLKSGQRFGEHVTVGLLGTFDQRPRDPFFGIGNGNQTEKIPTMPVDPRIDSTAVETYYRYRESRIALAADIIPAPTFHVSVTGALTDISFDSSTYGIPIASVYQPATIPGFQGGVQHAYGELELRWDTRHRHDEWEPNKLYSEGSLVAGCAGRIHRLDDGVDFWRYGVELQHFFRLARGPRTLITRFKLAGVTGSRDEVPFSELPELGGGDFLRGYSYNRFRDRIAAFGSLQYEWDLSHFVDGYIFADVGRVYQTLSEVDLNNLRLGYGFGVEVRSEKGFLTSASVASSLDGGVYFTVAFNPTVDARQRWR